MRIAVLHSRYSSGSASGENRVVSDEIELLRSAGHEVRPLLPSAAGLAGPSAARAGVQTVWSRAAVRSLRSLIETFAPQVVHCHNLFPLLSPAVIRTADSLGVPVVMTLHNYRLICMRGDFLRDGRPCEDCMGRQPWPGVRHRCYRGSLGASAAMGVALGSHRVAGSFDRVSVFLAASEFVREKHEEAGFERQRIRVKPQFFWETERRTGPGDYFLYAGRLSPEKGVRTVVEAWGGRAPGRLLVVGDGPEAAELRAAAGPRVEFTGSVIGDEVPRLLRGARALVVPSICYEGAPRAVVEAYAAGVPVVASAVGGLPSLVEEGVSGLMAEPGSAPSWVAAAQRLSDDGEVERLGEGAWRLWDERYRPERALQHLEEAYADAVAGGQAARVSAAT